MTDSTDAISIAGDYLDHNADSLVSCWIEWVRGRVGTRTVTALPERALRNHIPPVLQSLARYIRSPVELAREELLGHLRLHGEIRRDQGYSMEEVLAEFDGLADLVTEGVNEELTQKASDAQPQVLLEVATRLATGLRALSFIAMGTYSQADQSRETAMSASLEEFARAVGHELRSPLNTLTLTLDVLRSESVQQGSLDSYLDVMAAAVRRAADLLDTIRTLAVAEGARAGDRLVTLVDAVNRVTQDFSEEARSASVDVRISPKLPDVSVEAMLLYIALANVLGNAIKYSDPKKDERWVEIDAAILEEEHESGFCVVSVRDNGIGIPEDLQPRVFHRGLRAHPDHGQGTGHGLYIVQQALTSRGGQIEVESEEGKGTRFTFRARCLDNADGYASRRFRIERLMGNAALGQREEPPESED